METSTLAIALIAAVLVTVLAAQLLAPALRERRRARLRAQPLPSALADVIARNVDLYTHMPGELRTRLHGLINVFLNEKRFVGCAGQVVNDEIRVTIAAQACMLIVNRDGGIFESLHSILVYPRAFYVNQERFDDAGVVHESRRVLVGESWDQGRVVVSWDDAMRGGLRTDDGVNVVLHEFAHQLDGETGDVNGAPALGTQEAYSVWADTMTDEFETLRQRVGRGDDSLIDPYGATDPAEFFAVTTETFFEEPRALCREHPGLYQRLREFYRLDPAQWGH